MLSDVYFREPVAVPKGRAINYEIVEFKFQLTVKLLHNRIY